MRTANRKFIKWLCLGVVVIVLVYAVAYQSKSQTNPQYISFTAEYTETTINPITKQSFQTQQLYHAARSDGSTSSGWRDQRYGWRRVRDRAKLTQVTVADPQKLKTTLDYSYLTYLPFIKTSPNIPSDCRTDPGAIFVGTEMISGFNAFHYRRSTILGAGSTIRNEVWYSPDLNCFIIQHNGYRYNPQGLMDGVFEKKIMQITLGEPNDQLFDIPDDYAEVSEAERSETVLLQTVTDREGLAAASQHQIPLSVRRIWDYQDEHYYSVKNGQYKYK